MKKLMIIFFLLWNCIFCNPPNQVHWSHKVITIENDSVTMWIMKDSNRIDTIRYKKRTYYEQKSPRTLHGKWYLVTAIIVGIIIVLIFKK